MKFEDLEVRKISEQLIIKIYEIFQDMKDFGFRDQIQRASISITNNIAEGYERSTIKDKQRFLRIAKGSCGEVRNMLHFALKLGYLSAKEYEELHKQCISISKMIYAFIKTIK